ncbi:caspase family protein [Pseudoxanthomonas sp. z9]|uniref:caspase family protein n=1 Tax=Pseudoxanthomonas sp. z9 TaxID=2584942 RepID=UPI0011414110|nr:caspase family protein [Pseudoxanthomonas sp. z9]
MRGNCFRWRCIAAVLASGLGVAANAWADDTEALRIAQAPRRLALVVGNAGYQHLSSIPSAEVDARRMEALLRDLQFQVSPIATMTSAVSFEETTLPDFRRKIEEGDIVVVYFSGHGFSYGQNNYLAGTDTPLQLDEQNLPDHAVAVESLESYLAKKRPGLLLFIVDACRTIGGFVIKDRQHQYGVEKGYMPVQHADSGVNTLVAYGSRLGTAALGSSEATRPSTFTEALLNNLPRQPGEFGSVFNDVSARVTIATGSTQQPGVLDWSDSDFYFLPDDRVSAREREAWLSALESGIREQVLYFSRRFSTSHYAHAARQWLSTHDKDEPAYTLVFPPAVEASWSINTPVGISRADFGLAYARLHRVIDEITQAGPTWNPDTVGLVAASTKAPALSPALLETLKSNLQSQASLVASTNLIAYAGPDTSSGIESRVTKGDYLQFVDFVESSGTHSLWMQVRKPDDKLIYIPAPDKPLAPMSIGHPLDEVIARTAPGDLPELIDESAIQQEFQQFKAARKSVSWVSIAYEPSDRKELQLQRQARAAHTLRVLKKQGVPGVQITTTEVPQSGLGDGVRVRFFGY